MISCFYFWGPLVFLFCVGSTSIILARSSFDERGKGSETLPNALGYISCSIPPQEGVGCFFLYSLMYIFRRGFLLV
jgi:hypothetical protein